MTDFSVLMSVYHNEKVSYFKECLDSIVHQTCLPDEIVLVEDGPLPDDILCLIEQYKVKLNIVTYKLTENQGLAIALSEGIKKCNFELIARVDTDDINSVSRFEKQLNIFQNNPEVDVVGSNLMEFENSLSNLKKMKLVPEFHNDIVSFSKLRNPINHPSVMFKKSKVLQSGSYQNIPFFEDYYLWFNMFKNDCIFYNIQDPLVYFRTGSDMIGRRHGIKYFFVELKFYYRLFNENFISFFNFTIAVISRAPLRLIPKFLLKLLYNKFLRK
jgi:glycosyltransferase involved in cell wall biosynthesis